MHDGDDSDKGSVEAPSSPELSEEEIELPVVQTGTKPKKRSKKKNKQTQQSDNNIEDLDDEFLVTNTPVNGHGPTITKQVPSKNVLTLEQKNLNPDNELKKIFGSRVVASAQKKKARGRAYVKSTWLMNAKDNWSQIKKTGKARFIIGSLLNLLRITLNSNRTIHEFGSHQGRLFLL